MGRHIPYVNGNTGASIQPVPRASTPVSLSDQPSSIDHASRSNSPNDSSEGASEVIEAPQETVTTQKTVLTREQFRALLDKSIADYNLDKGKCPICKVPIKRGISGHLSKCLRSSMSKPESQATS
jgi:hypothetical protein